MALYANFVEGEDNYMGIIRNNSNEYTDIKTEIDSPHTYEASKLLVDQNVTTTDDIESTAFNRTNGIINQHNEPKINIISKHGNSSHGWRPQRLTSLRMTMELPKCIIWIGTSEQLCLIWYMYKNHT